MLFLIPARGGSRRVPGKNLRTVAGIPLVARAVRAARLAAEGLPGGPHAIACSTDDPAIASVAREWGAAETFLRPAELATDTASSSAVAVHALDLLEKGDRRFRAVVLVQPTSPLTNAADLRSGVERFDSSGSQAVVSVTPSHPATWHYARDEASGRIDTVGPERPGGSDFLLTGAFYIVAPAELRRTSRFVDPGRTIGFPVAPERSVDVDEEHDLAVAEALVASRPVRRVEIAGRAIGDGVFVIAEAGVNHDGRPEQAHALIDAAADAGADAVKFQTFDPAALAAAGAPMAEYQKAAGAGTAGLADQRAMLERLALPIDAWAALRDHARQRGLVFLSSPFDDASAELLAGLDVPAFKVGSGELTNLPFLARLAARGLPMLVSTGMADMRDVASAVDAIRAAGDPPVALLHCVSSYPAHPADANLRAIPTMRAAFGLPTGWSDHTPGIELPIAAVALGASIVEKHLTLDRGLPGPDHRASLEPAEFGSMVAAIRRAESALGSGDKRPVAAERAIAAAARRSLHWRRSLPAGTVVGEDDLAALRPGTGIPPGRVGELVGRPTTRPVTAGALVGSDDVQGVR